MATTLIPTWTLGGLDLTAYPFAIEFGGDHGAPESLSELVTSLLADGDLVRPTRHGNREISIVVLVEGASLGELAENEAVLRAECTKPNTMTFQPGDFDSPASVFDVLMVQMRQPRDETQEAHLMRRWELTLTCAPFARSANLVTVPALDVPVAVPTVVSINNADSTTGWTATVTTWSRDTGDFTIAPAPVTDAGDGVSLSTSGTNAAVTVVPAVPVVLSGTRYIVVEVSGGPVSSIQIDTGGSYVPYPVEMTRATPTGRVQLVIDVGDITVWAVRIWWTSSWGGTSSQPMTMVIHNVEATDTLPQVTARQVVRTIQTGGTERTPASILVETGAAAGGFTIVHTSPQSLQGYTPSLRQFRVSGNTVTGDANLISGARERVTLTPIEAQVPLTSLPPGEYALAAMMRSDTAGVFPITWTANSLIPGYGYLGETVSGVAQAEFTDPGFWTLVPLDVVTLPTVRASSTLAVAQLTINRAVVSEIIDVDEWWAFRIGDDSALTMVLNGTSRLWLDSPDVGRPVPEVWIGDFNNRADARHPGDRLLAHSNHMLHPEGTQVFVANNGAVPPSVSATFYRRWHSNAAE